MYSRSASYRPSELSEVLSSFQSQSAALTNASVYARNEFEAAAAGKRGNVTMNKQSGNQCTQVACLRYEPSLLATAQATTSSNGAQAHPPPMSGHTLLGYDGVLYLFGGFLCDGKSSIPMLQTSTTTTTVTNTSTSVGGNKTIITTNTTAVVSSSNSTGQATDCYSAQLWSFDPRRSASTSQWVLHRPRNSTRLNPVPWPAARAFHAAILQGEELIVFGGSTVQTNTGAALGVSTASTAASFLDDLWSLHLPTLTWSAIESRGQRPSARHRASLALDERGVAFLYGGSGPGAHLHSDWFQLRLGAQIQANNVFVSGPGLEKTQAGESNWLLIECRQVEGNRSSVGGILAPNATSTPLEWGQGLSFTVSLINENRMVTRALVTELGLGKYNASYTLLNGYKFQLYILLEGALISGGAPVRLLSGARLPSSRNATITALPTIRGEISFVDVHLEDEFGNAVRQGGDVRGATRITSTEMPATDEKTEAASANAGVASNTTTPTEPSPTGGVAKIPSTNLTLLVLPGAHLVRGSIPSSYLSLSSASSSSSSSSDSSSHLPNNAAESISDLGDGSYRIYYRHEGSSSSSSGGQEGGGGEEEGHIQLLLYVNGQLIGRGAKDTPMPLTLQAFPRHELTPALGTAGMALLIICTIVVLSFMLILSIYRNERVVRASSYVFLMTLCLGALFCFGAGALLPFTNTPACRSYPILLGLGYTLIIGSLFVKSQRIMSIFTTKKLQVLNLSNFRTGIPLLILLTVELVFSAVWLLSNPLHAVKEPYVNNSFQTYSHCDSQHKDAFVSATIIQKALLAAYGIFLATKTRNVPQAYNESKLMIACQI